MITRAHHDDSIRNPPHEKVRTARNILFFGATGFIGVEFLRLLREGDPGLDGTALTILVRNATPERRARLLALYPVARIIGGGLEDLELISRLAADADVVINAAS